MSSFDLLPTVSKIPSLLVFQGPSVSVCLQLLFTVSSDISERVKRTTWVYRMWGGVVRSRVICSRCQKPSDTFDSFLDLSIDVHNSIKTLLQMLQGFVREDRLEGDNKYHCEKCVRCLVDSTKEAETLYSCKAKAVASKSFKIASAPPVLTFHLKRFNMNYSTSNGSPRAEKCTQQVEYPERLDIAPFMVDKDVRDFALSGK